MKHLRVFALSCALAACTSVASPSQEPFTLLEAGGRADFERMRASGEYEQLLADIERGDDRSIRGVHLIARWTDAADTTALRYALSRGLINNPAAVMSLVPGHFTVAELCTVPYIEETADTARQHVNESIRALARLPGGGEVTECRTIYESLRRTLREEKPRGR